MEQKKFIVRLAIWTAVVTAVIIAIIGLCFGKVIEGNLLAEVTKWIVMGIVIIGILEGFILMGVGGILYHFWYERKHPRLDQD